MLLCFILILLPFPTSVLAVLSPPFLSRSAPVFHTSSSVSYLLGSFFPSYFPHLMFLLVVKPIFLSKLRMDVIPLPELPCCSSSPASIAPKGHAPSTEVSCSGRRSPPEIFPQALVADVWLVGAWWAAWGLCSQSASMHAASLEEKQAGGSWAPKEPSFSDLQVLEQNTDLCHCDESWQRCSGGLWNQCTFAAAKDTCSHLCCLLMHSLRGGTKGISQREPSMAAWITQEWAPGRKSVNVSKGSVCLSLPALCCLQENTP